MNKPLVSIIVPVYNCEKYIEKCLNSICNQTYESLEIIVVNDGSTDESTVLIQSILDVDKRIICVDQKNSGVSAARNKGINIASGKYITFIDGDDYIGKDYIQRFVDCAEQNESELCICGYTMVDEDGKQLMKSVPTQYKKGEHEEYPYRILATLSRFYRKDFWTRLNIHYEEDRNIRGEDIPIALVTNALAENIVCVTQTSYYYVQHGDSARNSMRGLKYHRLPYQQLEDYIKLVSINKSDNSYEFFEMGVIRVFVTFLFDLGIGAEKETLNKMIDFQKDIINAYFKDIYNNKRIRIFSQLQIPMMQRIAVKIYILIFRFKLLSIVGKLLAK